MISNWKPAHTPVDFVVPKPPGDTTNTISANADIDCDLAEKRAFEGKILGERRSARMGKSPENKEGEESDQDDLENESDKVKVVWFMRASKGQRKNEELPKGCELKRQKSKNAYKEITVWFGSKWCIGLAEVVATWTLLYLHRQLLQFYTT